MQLDVRVLEILASKICHDLISPVGAINNGIELIEDIGGSVVNDAVKLISASGQQAARRLRLFRMAYGKAGAEASQTIKDTRTCASEYLSGTKAILHWEPTEPMEGFAGETGGLKMVLNALMLAEETLSHGGTIKVEALNMGSGGHGILISVTGSHASLHEPSMKALTGETPVEEITPRTVHAYVCGKLAQHYGFSVSWEQVSAEHLSLILARAAENNVNDIAAA